ncbi:MAG: hypothetical protein IJR59_06250 [Firmicutes bacterium]|nr:hypothetical protein [Bacillota bacterium]
MDGIRFFIFLFTATGLMLAAYLYLKFVINRDKDNEKAEVSYNRTVKDMKDESNFTAKLSTMGYIQNNTAAITKKICILTPSFKSETFIEFAQEIFSKLAEDGGTAELDNVVSDNIDLSQLPNRINHYDHCYLHNLTITDKQEHLKVYISIDNGDELLSERYFAVFTRKSSFNNITTGGIIAVSCPGCGAALSFQQKGLKMCPYCGKSVKNAEYDWRLTSVERITNNTVVDNRAVLEG